MYLSTTLVYLRICSVALISLSWLLAHDQTLLQAIKLLGTEKGKKGCVNLLFHAGGRVMSALGKSLDIERQINSLMK